MGNIRVIDLSISPLLVDPVSYHDPQTANGLFVFKAQIALIFQAAILRITLKLIFNNDVQTFVFIHCGEVKKDLGHLCINC